MTGSAYLVCACRIAASIVQIGIRCETLSFCKFTKIRCDVWFEIEVPRTSTTKHRGVNDGAPHNWVPKHIQCAEHGRIYDYQDKYRHHEMARPRFMRGKTVRD